jgi:hypothetical protein
MTMLRKLCSSLVNGVASVLLWLGPIAVAALVVIGIVAVLGDRVRIRAVDESAVVSLAPRADAGALSGLPTRRPDPDRYQIVWEIGPGVDPTTLRPSLIYIDDDGDPTNTNTAFVIPAADREHLAVQDGAVVALPAHWRQWDVAIAVPAQFGHDLRYKDYSVSSTGHYYLGVAVYTP